MQQIMTAYVLSLFDIFQRINIRILLTGTFLEINFSTYYPKHPSKNRETRN